MDEDDHSIRDEEIDAALDEALHRLKALEFLVECMLEKAEAAIDGA